MSLSGIHGLELAIQFGQGLIHHFADRPEGMVLVHSGFGAKIAEYRLLLDNVIAPGRRLRIRYCCPYL
ncbi:MAG: hypothetical protein JRI57_02645 [Deltaproteobacteria bacterium]|nr:hypothetical protein [Deltaproteobacteria bacterium]MBW1952954.1 hypothetical protein [Deltaproteobacteria bacterium]MBW1987480.1 hypothetical protein [Deltaproteobacteria bacterium]